MKMRDMSVEIGHSLNCCCWTGLLIFGFSTHIVIHAFLNSRISKE
jgi:hypothetical protein